MPKPHTPIRTPLQSVTEVGTHRGRRILQATYPSATEKDAEGKPVLWTVTFDDSGYPIGCTCQAGRNHRPCWHQDSTGNAVVAFYKWLHADMDDHALRVHGEHLARYLQYPLDQPDREAAEHEAVAVCVLRAERAAGRAA